MKKRLLCILLALLMAAALLPVTASAAEIECNPKISDDGVLTWDAFGNGTYTVLVTFEWNMGYEYFRASGLTVRSYSVYDKLTELKADTDTYYVYVLGSPEGHSEELKYHYVSPIPRLSGPQNVRWEGISPAWDAVANAERYTVYLYDAKGKDIKTYTTKETSVTDPDHIPEDGWWFEVYASAAGYRNSNRTESPKFKGVYYNVKVNNGYAGLLNNGSADITEAVPGTKVYVFPETPIPTGAEWSMTVVSPGGLVLSETRPYYFIMPESDVEVSRVLDYGDNMIRNVSVTIDAPAVGKDPDYTIDIPANAGYKMGTYEDGYSLNDICWYEGTENPIWRSDGIRFALGKVYTAEIYLTPETGHVFDFDNVTATVNGKTVSTEKYYSKLIVRYTFPAVGGWVKNSAGKWTYYKDGVLAKGWLKDGGKWYYLNADGIMQKGWQRIGGKWYYLGTDGAMVTGWKQLSGKWYYMNSSGVMQTGKVQIGNYLYTFDTSGVWDGKSGIKNGWIKNSAGKWNYYKEGSLQKGWQKTDGKWYYLGTDGIMVTGWKQISGVWYYMNSSGVMQTGWQKISSKWYYFNSSGAMQTGWQKISGVWYFFESSGAMKTGWYKESGKWYYFKSSGAMACSESVTVGGKSYSFNSSGVCTNP